MAKYFLLYDINFPSIHPLKHEISLMAVGFLVVEAIEPHIRLADFLGTVVKRIRRVLLAYSIIRYQCFQLFDVGKGFAETLGHIG